MASSSSLEKSKRSAIRELSRVPTFNLRDAARLGIPQTTVRRLVAQGIFTRLERGIYSVGDSEPLGEAADFAVACKRLGPNSVIGGLSALYEYGLIETVPQTIWVLVPPNVRATNRRYRLLRTKRNLSEGIITKDGYRITSIERTLVDALIFASKIGERNAKTAIIKALRSGLTNEKRVFQLAQKINALPILTKHWESILAGVAQ